jgi:hypothetical protein
MGVGHLFQEPHDNPRVASPTRGPDRASSRTVIPSKLAHNRACAVAVGYQCCEPQRFQRMGAGLERKRLEHHGSRPPTSKKSRRARRFKSKFLFLDFQRR